jgi:hypothetical protein
MLSHDAGPLDTGPKPRGIVALYPACRWFAAIKKQRIGSRWSLGVFAATRRFAFGMADRLG